MKIFQMALAGLFLTACTTSSPEAATEVLSTDQNEPVAEVVANTESQLRVEGMVCDHGCVMTIEGGVNEMKGIASCSVSYEEGLATVTYDSTQVSAQEVAAHINTLADGHYTATVL
jgi:copper chaperone CopZ